MKNKYKIFYSTKEEYPAFRVDLTELFSNGITKHGFSIDWHMQAINNDIESGFHKKNEKESVFIGSKGGKGLVNKILNKWLAIYHDLLILKYVKKNKYDFVQVRDKVFAGMIGLIAAKRAGIPFYYWMSFPYTEADLFKAKDKEVHQPFIKRIMFGVRGAVGSFFLYKLVLKKADFIFVQSDRMLSDVAVKGIPEKKMMPVPMGINLESVISFEKKECPVANQLDGRKVLIYLGTMVRVRKIDFLVDVLSLLLETQPNAVLLLVGDASEKDIELIKNRAIELNILEKIIFTGFVPMDVAWNCILESDVCLSPFRPSPILDSTSPTKVVEYLALGRPVVANKHPDQSLVLNSSGAGFAVDYTPSAFAKACDRLLSNPHQAEKMGQKGVGYVEHNRSYEALIEKVLGKYQELMGEINK